MTRPLYFGTQGYRIVIDGKLHLENEEPLDQTVIAETMFVVPGWFGHGSTFCLQFGELKETAYGGFKHGIWKPVYPTGPGVVPSVPYSRLTIGSQQREDEYIAQRYINQKSKDGTYVELGACDGLQYSNTLFFNKALGFKGVLIEPGPDQYSRLQGNRPDDVTIHGAVSSSKKDSLLLLGDSPLAGIDETMASGHYERWSKALGHKTVVPVVRLDNILKEHRVKHVDLLSVDVEGGELGVLETMDWSIPVYVILIEMDQYRPAKNEECRKILRQVATLDGKVGNNEVWVNLTYNRRGKLFVSPQ